MLTGLLPKSFRPKIKLRPYQEAAIPLVHKEWEEGRLRTLLVQPCGTGKTTLGGRFIADEVDKGNRVLVCCHTRKLCRQFSNRVEGEFGIPTSVEMAGEREDGSACVSTTVQTMSRRILDGKFHPEEFSMLLFDEAHLSLGESFQAVAGHFSKAKIIGLTATPQASGKRDLLKFYDSMPVDVKLQDMIGQGYLSPLTVKNIPINLKLVQERKSGDFTDEDCGRAIEGCLEPIADAFVENARGRCSLVFLPLIALSKEFTSLLTERGFKAKHVDGTMDESHVEKIKHELEMGQIECVCCSLLWTIGIDLPPVNLICSLRGTKSWVLFSQMMGRGTRLFDPSFGPKGTTWPRKTDCIILDPLWEVDDHSLLQRPSVLYASNEEEAENIDKEIKKQIDAGGSGDLGIAFSTVKSQHEDRLRKRLEEMAKRKGRQISVLDLFLGLNRMDLAEYEPSRQVDMEAMTQGQRDTFIRMGISFDGVTSRGQAGQILEAVLDRRGLATLKMAKFAGELGMSDPYHKSFETVRDYIDKTLKNRK